LLAKLFAYRGLKVMSEHFDAPWQAQIFSLVVSLQEKGVIGLTEWTATVSEELKETCAGNDAYYEAWTRALERLLIEKGLAAPLQLTQLRMAWRVAAEKTPHGQAIVAPRMPVRHSL
jgi:nitrile hydratase accessory protein